MEYEESKIILEFPNYEVTNMGRVLNRNTGREMTRSYTQVGAATVGLVSTADGVQYRRSIRTLVARYFVDGESHINNTPIQLNGDRDDLRASNIRWRPRWFAWEYQHQFNEIPPYAGFGPILDVTHAVEYRNVMEACIANGYLMKHLYLALINEGRVYPTGDTFIVLKNSHLTGSK